MDDSKHKKGQTISVIPGDLYQFMIAECRYGYTRNNHLMPWGAFNHCRAYLPKMSEIDSELAERTAIQLAEEAIQELTMDAWNDEKKQFTFFQEGIPGIGSELHSSWSAGTYDFSIELEFQAAAGIRFLGPKKDVYYSFEETGNPEELTLVTMPFDKMDFGYSARIYVADPKDDKLYHSIQFPWDSSVSIAKGAPLLFTAHKNDGPCVLSVRDYEEFIEYCIPFGNGRLPYNYSDYNEFLLKHPQPQYKK